MNAENIPGMCVLTNRARDLVTAENERVSQSRNRVGSRIVLKGLKIKSSSLNLGAFDWEIWISILDFGFRIPPKLLLFLLLFLDLFRPKSLNLEVFRNKLRTKSFP